MAKVKAKKSEVVEETKKDIKKKQKKIKLQNQREVSETEQEVKRFVCILIVLLIIIGCIYFLTSRNTGNKTNTTTEATIQYNEISVGMILNRNEYSEYYVLAYLDDSSNYADLSKLYKAYQNKTGNTKLYTVDLNDPINKDFVTKDTPKINVTNAADFKFSTDTLLYIKDGKISKTYTTFKSIENVLK